MCEGPGSIDDHCPGYPQLSEIQGHSQDGRGLEGGGHYFASGSESLEDYFQKGALLDQKRHLIFGTSIPSQIFKNCSRAFEGQSYLAYTIQKTTYV